MKVTNIVNIDLSIRQNIPFVDAVQGDSARAIEFRLFDKGQPLNVPDGSAVLIRYKRPDGFGGVYDTLPNGETAYSISTNKVTAVLSPTALGVAGNVDFQVTVSNGDDLISAFALEIRVDADPSADVVDAEDYINISQFVTQESKKNAPYIGENGNWWVNQEDTGVKAGGGSGGGGADGFSPVAKVTQTDNGATITITDKNGTTTATVTNGRDGKDGAKGETGAQGDPGKDGANGKDGVSAIHSWNGTTLTITSASGTSSANLKGEKGDKGDKGDTGDQGADGKDGTNGKDGTSVTVKSVSESTADGGSNVVTFSDGKTITIKNGSKGSTGATGGKGDTGATGQRGTGLLSVTTAPSSYTTAVGGITPKYRMAISTIKTQAGVTEVLLGDTVRYSYYHYPIDYLDASYAYFTERVSIRGATGAAGKDAVLTMFISPDGNDSNDGLTASTPKKTVKACVTAGAKRISAKRGVYNEIVQLSNISELEILPTDNDLTYAVGVEREPIVFDTSDTVAVSSLAAYNSIKRVAYSNSANTQFDKVFTKKSQTPIYGDGNGSRYNSTIWLLSSDEKTVCIKLKPVLTVAECEAQANTFTYVSGYIYINANMASVAKIVVPTNWDCGIYINGAERFVLKEVEVRFAGSYNIDIRNCAYFDFYKCACKYTSYGSGFHPFNSNGKLTACYATKNYDGYGISGYGHTTYVDCVSEFNFDDGMSHHNATTGTVIGGRYEGNGKGGNVPAYGAKVNIYGGLYKDNESFGIGYLWSTDLEPASGMVQGAVMVGNPVGLSVQKNCVVTAMNCTYQGNTSDKDVKGNLTEYNANYVKTVNDIEPDENGNVKIDVSGGSDTGSSYTNLLPLAVNASNTLYVGDNGEKGYRVGYRISSSGTEKAATSCCCTGYIPVKSEDTIRIKNFTPELGGYGTIYFFSSLGGTPSNPIYTNTTSGGNMATPDANGLLTTTALASGYFRLTAATIDSTTIITVNEEITE